MSSARASSNVIAVPAPVMLSTLTSLGLGGPAPELIQVDSAAAVVAAIRDLDAAGQPVLVVAGGSNLVISDDGIDYPVLRLAHRGVRATRDGDRLIVDVAAGEPWDDLVAQVVADGWSGIEFLSGIPGSTGATPIQNVGAYGAEVSDVLLDVTVYHRPSGAVRVIPASELALSYRSSVLRGNSDSVVLRLRLALSHTPAAVRYGELASVLGVAPGQGAPPSEVRAAVLGLRRGKGMVLDPADPDTRSAGSFFTNPLLSAEQLAAVDLRIQDRLGDVRCPRYPAGEAVKLSAAWLIERAGFPKGFALPRGGAAISTKHTLALTNRGGSTDDLLALARHLRDGVRQTFGVELHPEPIFIGVAL